MDARHMKLAVEIGMTIEDIERIQKSKSELVELLLIPPRLAMSAYAAKYLPIIPGDICIMENDKYRRMTPKEEYGIHGIDWTQTEFQAALAVPNRAQPGQLLFLTFPPQSECCLAGLFDKDKRIEYWKWRMSGHVYFWG